MLDPNHRCAWFYIEAYSVTRKEQQTTAKETSGTLLQISHKSLKTLQIIGHSHYQTSSQTQPNHWKPFPNMNKIVFFFVLFVEFVLHLLLCFVCFVSVFVVVCVCFVCIVLCDLFVVIMFVSFFCFLCFVYVVFIILILLA